MNDKQFVEASRHFAERVLAEGGDSVDSRLTWAFRTLTARTPSERELTVLRQVLEEHRTNFAANPQAASEFIDSATTLLTRIIWSGINRTIPTWPPGRWSPACC